MSCLLIGAALLSWPDHDFTLEWIHSVERVSWQESWQVSPDGLRLTQARIKGSGAGMEPGERAQMVDGWWQWSPDIDPQPQLLLAASGTTISAWTLCAAGNCREIGAAAGAPVALRPCPKRMGK